MSLFPPTKTPGECNLGQYDEEIDRLSIFEKKKIKGFWPVYDDSMGERELTVSKMSEPQFGEKT